MATLKKLIIVVAFKEEAKLARKVLEQRTLAPAGLPFDGEVHMSGMGPARARAWAEQNLETQAGIAVLITGFCGGLSVPTHVGDVILPNQIIQREEETGKAITFLPPAPFAENMGRRLICAGARYKAVPLVTINRIVESEAERRALFLETQAEAVDMETACIAAVCARRDHPYFALKVVSDDQTSELTGLNEIYQRGEELNRASMGKWLLEHPVLAMKMRGNWGEAKGRLENTLGLALDELAAFFSDRISK